MRSDLTAGYKDDLMKAFDWMVIANVVGTIMVATMLSGVIGIQSSMIGQAQVGWYIYLKSAVELASLETYTGVTLISTVLFAGAYRVARKAAVFLRSASDITSIVICGVFCVVSAPTAIASAIAGAFDIAHLMPMTFFSFSMELAALTSGEELDMSFWPFEVIKIAAFVLTVGLYASVLVRPLKPVSVVKLA